MAALRRPRKKAVLIGIDAAMLEHWDQYIAEGLCPNIARLLREGASAEACSAPPPATSVNWNTIATGCYAGGHGVHGMNFREIGASLVARNVSAFNASYRTAESLWEANQRGGGSNLLLRYTCSWPPSISKGVQVDGHGNPGANLHQVSQRHAWATYPLFRPGAARDNGLTPYAHQITLREGTWPNAPAGISRSLEAELPFKLSRGRVEQPLFALIVDYGDGRGYSEARLSTRRDWDGSVGGGAGAWTAHLKEPIRLYAPSHEWDPRDGNGPIDSHFYLRFKVMELAPGADGGVDFKLYAPGAFPDTGWTVPNDLCATLVREVGPYVEPCGIGGPFRGGWIDVPTFNEEQEDQVEWLSAAARYLMPRTDWDLFMAQIHIVDQAGHSFLGHTDPASLYFDPSMQEACTQGFRRAHELADRYVGAVLENVPADATVMLVSDHGMYPVRVPVVDVNAVLAGAGLYSRENPAASQAAWFYESQIRVNLRGREEGGVVAPGAEYEAVRDRVIRALEDHVDPRTGERLFQLVLRAEDAAGFGWYGDRVGDICYFQKPRLAGPGPGAERAATRSAGQAEPAEWTAEAPTAPVSAGEAEAGGRRAAARMIPGSGEHLYYWQMGARPDGSAPGGRAMFILKAPGVKRGYRRPAPVELVDAAPTLAYVSGIPVPRHAEGRIRHDLFEEELF